MKRLALLVTGSRDWTSEALIEAAIKGAMRRHAPTAEPVLIHGGAIGADMIADRLARRLGFTVLPMPADWAAWRISGSSAAAGPARNNAMVRVLSALRDCGYTCEVLAFPKARSKGTWDCVNRAKLASFDVDVWEGADGAAKSK
jgi:hypothetical protein